jgi:hypothetical protein
MRTNRVLGTLKRTVDKVSYDEEVRAKVSANGTVKHTSAQCVRVCTHARTRACIHVGGGTGIG